MGKAIDELSERTPGWPSRTWPRSTAGSMFEDIFDATTRFRDDGNALFRMRDYDGAAQHYAKAIDELSERTPGWPSRTVRTAVAPSGSEGSIVPGSNEAARSSPVLGSAGFKRLSSG